MSDVPVSKLDEILVELRRLGHGQDRLFASQERLAKAVEEQETALSLILAAFQGVTPILDTQTEILRQLWALANEEPAEGQPSLADILARIEQAMKLQSRDLQQIRLTLQNLPDQVEASTIDGVRLAMGDGIPVPPSPKH